MTDFLSLGPSGMLFSGEDLNEKENIKGVCFVEILSSYLLGILLVFTMQVSYFDLFNQVN